MQPPDTAPTGDQDRITDTAARCTCANDGNASRCSFHTQADYDAARRAREDATERGAIVAWLRGLAREGGEIESDDPRIAAVSSAYATVADLIEEGAHHAG